MRAPSAGTAADPYPFYAQLRAQAPLLWDDSSGLWLATDLAGVRAVMAAPEARTRPQDALVPSAIVDTPAGRIFERLIRMTDGPIQVRAKTAVVQVLGAISPHSLGQQAQFEAARLLAEGPVGAVALGFAVPVFVMADALGFTGEDRSNVRHLIADFVQGLSPSSSLEQVGAAIAAASALEAQVAGLIATGMPGLAHALNDALAGSVLPEPLLCTANAIGLMSQTYDATGALVSLALVALARVPDGAALFAVNPRAFIREVARHDAPIQNTRRFFDTSATIMGCNIAAGQTVLLLLGSANRDSAGNSHPDTFDSARTESVSLTFSSGAHRCPGEEIALALAAGIVAALLESGFDPAQAMPKDLHFLPSANARIALIA